MRQIPDGFQKTAAKNKITTIGGHMLVVLLIRIYIVRENVMYLLTIEIVKEGIFFRVMAWQGH